MVKHMDVTHVILTEVDWKAHSIESLMAALVKGRVIEPPDHYSPHRPSYGAALMYVCDLLLKGPLDMTVDGTLTLLEDPDPVIEKFRGDWYVTHGRTITGPMSKAEADKCASRS